MLEYREFLIEAPFTIMFLPKISLTTTVEKPFYTSLEDFYWYMPIPTIGTLRTFLYNGKDILNEKREIDNQFFGIADSFKLVEEHNNISLKGLIFTYYFKNNIQRYVPLGYHHFTETGFSFIESVNGLRDLKYFNNDLKCDSMRSIIRHLSNLYLDGKAEQYLIFRQWDLRNLKSPEIFIANSYRLARLTILEKIKDAYTVDVLIKDWQNVSVEDNYITSYKCEYIDPLPKPLQLFFFM